METVASSACRKETDSIGSKNIPFDVYYGLQTLRASENFRITGLNIHDGIINSLAEIKKAAALTNCEVGLVNSVYTSDMV